MKHETIIYVGLSPLPVRVTTRIITCLVGNPYKPSFPLLLGGGTTQHIWNHYPKLHFGISMIRFTRILVKPPKSVTCVATWQVLMRDAALGAKVLWDPWIFVGRIMLKMNCFLNFWTHYKCLRGIAFTCFFGISWKFQMQLIKIEDLDCDSIGINFAGTP